MTEYSHRDNYTKLTYKHRYNLHRALEALTKAKYEVMSNIARQKLDYVYEVVLDVSTNSFAVEE